MTTVVTTATGSATGEPDVARVRLGVNARADDPASARSEAAAGADSVKAALDDLGLDDDAVYTDDIDVRRARSRPHDPDPDEDYEATYTYRVDLADVDRVGTVVDAAVEAGATGVDRVRFTFSEGRRRDLEATALGNAMERARAQAEVLADSEGLAVAGVERVQRHDRGGSAPGRQVGLAGGEEDELESGTATQVEPGSITVSETVEVAYEAE